MSMYKSTKRWIQKRFQKFRWPRMLTIGFYWSILVFPLKWFIQNWQQQRLRDLLMGIPAITGLIAVSILAGKAQLADSSLSQNYFAEAQSAIAQKNYTKAQMLLTRVLNRKDARLSEAQFSLAVLLDETGQKNRASELFRILAPDDRRGNRAAHRRLAMILAEQSSIESDPLEIKRLYWHLNAAADETTPEMAMAWGQYFLLSKDPETAARYFERAVEQFPQLWQTLGRIEIQTGNQAGAISSFRRSADYLSDKLRNDPKNDRIRIDYAQVLMNVGRLDDARIVLEQGRLLNPDGPWPFLLASLSVNYHDLMANQGKPLSELLGYLDRALTSDPNHGGALNRLMSYATAKVDGNIELRTVLSRVIAEGEQPALAHLAMGNLCWIENLRDQAMFHFERAMEIRSDMTALLNNMAWLIANDPKNPDLDRAMALITSALKTRPDDASFLDTRGTIYFLQEDWRSALADLEQALSGVRDKSAVHKKLAIIYDKLKLPEIAEQHRLLGQSITPKESP